MFAVSLDMALFRKLRLPDPQRRCHRWDNSILLVQVKTIRRDEALREVQCSQHQIWSLRLVMAVQCPSKLAIQTR